MAWLCITEVSRGSRKRVLDFDNGDERITSRDVIRLLALESGEYLDPGIVFDQVSEAETAAALERALRLLNYRERSVFEMRAKLLEDGYPDEIAQALVERFCELQLLDDERFAGCLVRTKRLAGWGRVRVARALADAGVSEQTALEALAQGADLEYERALAIALRRPPTDHASHEKVLAKLVRKGFPFDVALRATRSAAIPQSEGEQDPVA